MRPDTIIRNAQTWMDLFHRLTVMTPKEKGDVFERVVQLYLQTHPEYQSILQSVWLLNEVPAKVRAKLNLPSSDEGIDLIAQTNGGQYWAIQAKFRSNTDSRLTNKGDLATFTALAFHTCKHIDYGLVCATTSQPLKKVALTGDKTGFCLFADFAALDDENCTGWKRLKSAMGKAPERPKQLSPMWHQKKAIKNARRHFVDDKEQRGKMIMPCGTGKSLTGFWIAQNLDAKRILVAVPSLALVKQTLNVWTREYLAHNVTPEWICVCSDAGSGEIDSDEFTAHTYDLGVPCTTDREEIAKFLKKRGDAPKIVFTTYQSGRVLAEAAAKANRSFDLGIMDEAHKTVGRKDKTFAHLLHEENIKISRRLFMTATERQFIGSSDEIASMDDVDVYGETFELLSFKEAIENKQPIICDYKLVTIGISEKEIRDLWEDNAYLRISSDKLDEVATRSLAAGLALRKAYSKFNVKRAISFHGSIKKAENFKLQQEAITDVFPELAKVDCHHVSSRVPTSKRAAILRDFAEAERGLITNARCLTEGVDIPSVDCVLFADPRRSTIDIVQAAGRAMRKAKDKQYGYIIVPMVVPDEVDIDEFSQGTEFKEVVRTIRPLAANDDRIVEYFRSISEGKRMGADGPIVFDGDVELPVNVDEASFVNSLQLKVWGKVAKISWRAFEEARDFVRSQNLANVTEWYSFAKSGKLPPDIPTNPNVIYRNAGWAYMGDWLGTGRISSKLREFRPFVEARDFARSLNLSGVTEWREYCKSGAMPQDIPAAPSRTYEDSWVDWGDWLGTGNVAPGTIDFRNFEDAREYARGLGLKSTAEWSFFAKSGNLPSDIPAAAHSVYKDVGWAGMGDWLGTGNISNRDREFLPFSDARKFAQNLKLGGNANWRIFAKSGALPSNIPATPERTYKDVGWKGYGDWLGTGNIAPQDVKYRAFEQARAYACSRGFSGTAEWKAFAKSGNLPPDIPASPANAYKNRGWKSWGDWLGTGFIATHAREYREFAEARKFARRLRLNSYEEWRLFSKSEELPPDIPANPNVVYKNQGWSGIGDWLGTGRVANRDKSFRPFKEARNFVWTQHLKSANEWRSFAKSGERPSDIPANPNAAYKKEWISWGDWLGKFKKGMQ
jgi:superfamily II DNA or RNA helicase